MNLTTLSHNTTAAQEWVNNVVTMVRGRFFDGITFDYEEPLEVDSIEAQTYVRMIRNTKRRLGRSYQVTVCVAWSPDGIDGRNYPVRQLAQASDALYVMDYDTQSQITSSACVAAANAPYYGMVHGLGRYLSLGVPPRRLILGVPWYGYRYPCLPGTAKEDRFCPLQRVPFRGVPCSDAAGKEIPLLGILRTMRERNATLHRDDNMLAPYFNTVEENEQQVIQYWFDDAVSLQRKYAWAKAAGLAGVGPFVFHDILPTYDPLANRDISVAMWSAFDSFFVETAHETENTGNAFHSPL
jgi:di-N-acetylchitobiase